MQEWIIAMLVVSILLMLRDMAKTVFSGRTQEKEELIPPGESHPQKEKVERYAESFRKLADTFYGMPYRKEFLSSGQLNRIVSDTSSAVCSRCYQREICWGERAGETLRLSENMIRTMEEGDEEAVRQSTKRMDGCLWTFGTVFSGAGRGIPGRTPESCLGQPHDRESSGCCTAAYGDIQDYGSYGRGTV